MENIATIIESIATILWPLIVIIILVSFRQNIQSLIKSSETRKFQIKIGEMELSMDEFGQQQALMIKDLQTRVNEIQRQIEGQTPKAMPKATAPDIIHPVAAEINERRSVEEDTLEAHYEKIDLDDDISAILWVDDHPKNNALLIASLQKSGIAVSSAVNTKEAVERFKHGSFDCVISDSCRHEGRELDNCQAGIELSSQIRETNSKVPIYLYTDKVDAKFKQKAEDAGATAVTSSPSELLKLLSD